jgi:hypothetical protein
MDSNTIGCAVRRGAETSLLTKWDGGSTIFVGKCGRENEQWGLRSLEHDLFRALRISIQKNFERRIFCGGVCRNC